MIAAIDIGGSSVKSGAVGPDGPIGAVTVTPLVHTAPADELVSRLAAAVRAAGSGPSVAAAVPDPFDTAAGVSRMTHKFAALNGRPLGPLLAAELGTDLDVRWCNDAAAAIAGEALHGAGAGARRVLGVTLGTGLGAALIADGRVVERAGGHVVGALWQSVLTDGRTADEAFSARCLLAELDRDPRRGGHRFGTELGALLAPVAAAAAADLVVVGGGGAGSFDRIEAGLAATLPIPAVRATLGVWGPLVGAARLCFPG